jgi:hypothetical protein
LNERGLQAQAFKTDLGARILSDESGDAAGLGFFDAGLDAGFELNRPETSA